MTTDDLGMREELSRMQVMLLQYAHLVLELRQQLPSAHERPEQIPAKLDALRSAISVSTPQHRPAAVTLDAGFGQRALKLATPSGGPISMMHGGHSSDAVQAELAQLRLQVEDLQQQEARQRMEVEAAYDALGPASAELSPGRGRPRLQEGVAGLRRALEEAQSLAVQQGEVSKLTQRQLEAAQLQVTARQRQLEAQSLEAERAGEQAADTHVALQAQIHALQSELQQARSAVDESRSQLELSRSQAAGSDARTLQQAAELADAQQRAAAAESELIAAEAETRHALPQWQEQLQRAEAQLRDLGAQVKDKDAGLLREREERAREVGEARRRADAAEAEARRAVVAAAADGGRTDELQQQQRMAFERKDREVAALTQQLASLQADHGALQRAQQQLAADREALHDRYNGTQERYDELHRKQAADSDELHALRERGSSGEAALRLQLDDLRSGDEQSRASLRQAQREATTASQAMREQERALADERARTAAAERRAADGEEAARGLRVELQALQTSQGLQTSQVSEAGLQPGLHVARSELEALERAAHQHGEAEREAQAALHAARQREAALELKLEALASDAAAERRRLTASLSESEARAAQGRAAPQADEGQQQQQQQLEQQLAAMTEAQAQLERGETERVRLTAQLKQVEEEAAGASAQASQRQANLQAELGVAREEVAAERVRAAALEEEAARAKAAPPPPAPAAASAAATIAAVAPPPRPEEVAVAAATEGSEPGSGPASEAGFEPEDNGEVVRPPALEVGDQGSFAWSGTEGGVSGHYASLSHIGGSGSNAKKENQDSCFVARCDESTCVWGVLDGHGSDNGRLAAQAGAKAFKAWFLKKPAELTRSPQQAMKSAFRAAHEAIRQAVVRRYEGRGTPLKTTAEGYLLDDSGQPVDGGATATVVALVQGHLLVVANVGDSDALLGGKLPDGSIGFEQLCANHTPLNADEFIRVAQLAQERSKEWQPGLFAYDIDGDTLLEVFAVSEAGEVDVDRNAEKQVEEAGVGFKNARGERPTALFAVETETYCQFQLGVTRSLGDFYLQHFGVSWEPAVSCIDLFDVAGQLSQVTLVVASDGLWDLWQYKDVLQYMLGKPPPAGTAEVLAPLGTLVEETRKQGEELFGEQADNITAMFVCCDIKPQ